MGPFKKPAAVGNAKRLYGESRKPQNMKRIDDAMASFKGRRSKGRRPR